MCNATRNTGDHCRALRRASQQYTFEHTLQGGEFAQNKIATHFTMLNVQNTLVLLFAVLVVLANANTNGVNIRNGRSNLANNSPRQKTLKGLGISALKIVNPNRTKFSYAAIVENNFRAERAKKVHLETKLNRLQAELHEMLYPTAPKTNSTAKEIADRMPVHQNEDFQNKLKVARYLRTGSKELPLSKN